MNAPVCPISRSQAVSGMPGRQLPFAPRAQDLPSLIAAVNALRDLVLSIYGPGTPLNNMPGAGTTFNGGKGSAAQDPGKPTVVMKQDWKEIRRYEEDVRVYRGGNKSSKIYIDVLRINKLVFHWEHNDIFMLEDIFEWSYKKSDYTPDYWSMEHLWSIPTQPTPA